MMILSALALGGCAVQSQPPVQAIVPASYKPSGAGALCFDPPVLAGTPRMDLSRDDRQPGAFEGYQDSSTTLYYQSAISDQRGGIDGDGFERYADSETYGASYR
jgi:hypothetical protein